MSRHIGNDMRGERVYAGSYVYAGNYEGECLKLKDSPETPELLERVNPLREHPYKVSGGEWWSCILKADFHPSENPTPTFRSPFEDLAGRLEHLAEIMRDPGTTMDELKAGLEDAGVNIKVAAQVAHDENEEDAA